MLAAIGTTAALAAAAPASTPTLAAIARIEPGEWQVKTVGSDAAPRMLCIANPAALIHFDRRGAACRHSVVTDQPDLAAVQYRCPGNANGTTTFRIATPRAFDLDIQGIAGGAPYEESFEAHRIGACSAPGAR